MNVRRREQPLGSLLARSTKDAIIWIRKFPLLIGSFQDFVFVLFLLSSLYNEAEVAAGPVLAFFVIFLFLWKTKTGQKRPHVMSLESRAAKLLSPVSCVSSSFFSYLSLSISVFLSLPRFLLYCLLSLLCHLSCIPFSPYLSLSISLFLLLPCRFFMCFAPLFLRCCLCLSGLIFYTKKNTFHLFSSSSWTIRIGGLFWLNFS